MEFLLIAELGKAERFGGVDGFQLAGEDSREPGSEGCLLLGRRERALDLLGKKGIVPRQVPGSSKLGDRLAEPTLVVQGGAEARVMTDVAWLELNRPAHFEDR